MQNIDIQLTLLIKTRNHRKEIVYAINRIKSHRN